MVSILTLFIKMGINGKMRKIIDIPENILQELKILAVKSNKDLKNFIQDELKKLVENSQSKLS